MSLIYICILWISLCSTLFSVIKSIDIYSCVWNLEINDVLINWNDDGTAADVFLWRNKKISASVLGTATAIWILFELLEYHLLTLICHILIFTLAVLFLWANASTFINK